MKNLNVLLVSGGGFQGLSLIKGLRRSKAVRIVLADNAHENVCKYLVDCFYQVPLIAHEREFIASLSEICKKENIKIIFPSTELELSTLAKHADFFQAEGVRVAVSSYSLLKTLQNKKTLYQCLSQAGFKIVPLADITQGDVAYPLFGKPLYGFGGKGTIILREEKDKKKYNHTDLRESYVWQPYLADFEEYSVDCAINFEGKVSDISIRKRVATLNGYCTIAESIDNYHIEDTVKKFLSFLKDHGGCGIFNIQIIHHRDNYYISDVNPRIGTSSVFAYQWKVNMPLFLCSSLVPELISYERDNGQPLKMVRYLEELWINKENSKNIKGIVFDLDDTLINQKSWIFDKLALLYNRKSKLLPPREIFLSKAIQIIEEGNRSKLFDALAEIFQFSDEFRWELINKYKEITPHEVDFFPGTLMVLHELKAKGYKLALLTDNPVASQRQKLRVSKLEALFDNIVYSRALHQEKPQRGGFEEVSKRLKIPPLSLVMVGDNLYRDVEGAIKAGYGFAYWTVQEGTFFNFDENLYNKLGGNKSKVKKIKDLRELLYDLC
ncbi:MAG: HAD-IA family hydrolase [bacterium]